MYPVLIFLFACVVSLLVPSVILLLVALLSIFLISLFLYNINAARVLLIMYPLLDCHIESYLDDKKKQTASCNGFMILLSYTQL